MSIFKFQKHSVEDHVKLLERLNYIRDPIATTPDLWCSAYVSMRYPYDEMMFVKHCHVTKNHNTLWGRQFFEFIVSLPEEESCQLGSFSDCMREVVSLLAHWQGGHHQVLSCIHLNTDNLHAHIIENNIDFLTGARFTPSQVDFCAILDGIDGILKKHGFSGLLPGFRLKQRTNHLYQGVRNES